MAIDELSPAEEAELRARTADVHTPALDKLRAAVRTWHTSTLIMTLQPHEMMAVLELDVRSVPPVSDAYRELVFTAGLLAVTDEIDRRIPVPT